MEEHIPQDIPQGDDAKHLAEVEFVSDLEQARGQTARLDKVLSKAKQEVEHAKDTDEMAGLEEQLKML